MGGGEGVRVCIRARALTTIHTSNMPESLNLVGNPPHWIDWKDFSNSPGILPVNDKEKGAFPQVLIWHSSESGMSMLDWYFFTTSLPFASDSPYCLDWVYSCILSRMLLSCFSFPVTHEASMTRAPTFINSSVLNRTLWRIFTNRKHLPWAANL